MIRESTMFLNCSKFLYSTYVIIFLGTMLVLMGKLLASAPEENSNERFKQALEILSQDPRVQKAQLDKDTAKSSLLSGRSNFLPSLSINASQTDRSTLADKLNTLSGTASLNLFKGGSDFFSLKNSTYQTEVAEQTTQTKLIDVELEGALAMFENIQARQNVSLQESILEMAKKNLEISKERFNSGHISKTDTLKAEVEFNNQNAATLQARETLASSQSSIQYLFGSFPTATQWPWFNQRTESVISLIKNLKTMDLDVSNRPDLLALKNLEQQLHSQKRALIGNFLPRLDFDLSRNVTEFQNSRSWETVGTLTMTFSLFNRMTDYNGYTILSNQSLAAEYETRFQSQKSQAEATALQALLLINLENVVSLQKNLKIARELYSESLNRFRRGQSSYSELALDLERYVRAEQLLLAQTASAHRQLAQFCRSLGKSQLRCLP
jgi:outer membrane protein TolC